MKLREVQDSQRVDEKLGVRNGKDGRKEDSEAQRSDGGKECAKERCTEGFIEKVREKREEV